MSHLQPGYEEIRASMVLLMYFNVMSAYEYVYKYFYRDGRKKISNEAPSKEE